MCNVCTAIELEHAIAVAERELIFAEADEGSSFPGATRPLSADEKRSKTRFGDIARLQDDAADAIAKIIDRLGDVVGAAILAEVFGDRDDATPAEISAALAALIETQPAKVKAEILTAQTQIAATLGGVYVGASKIAADEAARQGVKGSKKLSPAERLFEPLGRAVAVAPWSRLLGKVQAELLEPRNLTKPVIEKAAVEKVIADTPVDGAKDLARQSIHAAHGAGRYDTAVGIEPTEIWASELLDGATCGPCSRVDGKSYESMADALTEYESGGYGACLGGARCRGTLIFLYST